MEAGQIFVGTSGWTYDDWSGAFYPEDVKGSERLAYYVTRFNTVEINATFYRLPTQPMLDAWNRRLPDGFSFGRQGLQGCNAFEETGRLPRAAGNVSRSG